MKKINIIEKNFYTQNILKQIDIQTNKNTLKELLKEQNYNIQDYIIFSEKDNTYVSVNNYIENNASIVLINADGKIKRK